jgi:HD superfamily phosphohydrolase
MYWQVYLHKTVVSAEVLLTGILRRAKELARSDESLFSTPALRQFLLNDHSRADFQSHPDLLDVFASLDDSDITVSIKQWSNHGDAVLADLCKRLMNRQLFKIILRKGPFEPIEIAALKSQVQQKMQLTDAAMPFYFLEGSIVNNAYSTGSDKIRILMKNGSVLDISEAADTLNIKVLSEAVEKHYCCFPKC